MIAARLQPSPPGRPLVCGASALFFLLAASGGVVWAEDGPCAPPAARSGGRATMERFYDALARGDAAAVAAVTTSDFEAFDGGARFDRTSLVGLIAALSAQGKRYHWTLTDTVASTDCRTAFLRWTNRGFVEDATGRTDRVWLESASLAWDGTAWRVAFLHSTPVRP